MNNRLKFSFWVRCFTLIFLLGLILSPVVEQPVVQAEGSRELSAGGGKRALTEWRTSMYAGFLRARTFLQVFAYAGETLNLGSSGMGVGAADIAIWVPGRINTFADSQSSPLPAPDFLCSNQAGKGLLNTRAKELAGPLPAAGGYDPCIYPIAQTGIYWVAFYGPDGALPATDRLGTAGTIDTPNVGANQYTGVSMWDITVRSAAGTNIPGRVFTDYLKQYTGGNGTTYRVYSTLYAITPDGYKYQVDLRGMDPNGFSFYGNTVGYLDPDGITPLYHDLVASDDFLTTPEGGVQLTQPTAKLFFNTPAADLPTTIAPVPVAPVIQNVLFEGTRSGSTSYQNTGGVFTYTGNVGGITEIIISRNGTDFTPTVTTNRVLRSEKPAGSQQLVWDGRDNAGAYFPTGDFNFRVLLHAGEFHFPMLDVENSTAGGPTITLLNPPGGTCPFATTCRQAFYDDRGYRVSTGTLVGTVNTTLAGSNPPGTSVSNFTTGFDSNSDQRAFGATGSTGFGNEKGLDLWTYYPTNYQSSTLSIIAAPGANTDDLQIRNTHTGDFEAGGTGQSLITVSNVGTRAPNGMLTVSTTLPTGLTPTLASGTGWTCNIAGQTVTCTATPGGGLPAGGSLPPITLTTAVSATAPASQSFTANLAVGGSRTDDNLANNADSDTINIIQVDYGDLPTGYAATLKANNGASHTIGSLYLGSTAPTPKGNGTESAESNADGSDNGIARVANEQWLPGATVHLDATVTGNNGYLAGWFDFNNDGDFDDLNEMMVFGALGSGTTRVPLTLPASYVTGTPITSRFRLYDGAPVGSLPTYYGRATNGEVEDYRWHFSPTLVQLVDFRAESGVNPGMATWLLAAGAAVGALLIFGTVRRLKKIKNLVKVEIL